jgi:hypothetical protein
VLLTWEGRCKLQFTVFCIFSYLLRWGARYDHGDDEVRRSLLDFAQEKLLCASSQANLTNAQTYAVLSQRLALGTGAAKYRFNSENPLMALDAMHEQIANHMRVAVAMEGGTETLRGIASSEPILSEAASRIMLNSTFSLPRALSVVLDDYYINQEDRGELIVASLFTWARDRAASSTSPRSAEQLCSHFSVEDLFEQLFSKPRAKLMLDSKPSFYHTIQKLFKDEFRDAKVHFNHFIRPQEAPGRLHLLHLMARGAAALSGGLQCGYDIVIPFLEKDEDLDVKKVGFIMVKVKKEAFDSGKPAIDGLFSTMDPFSSGLVDSTDCPHGFFPIPIIRIIFLLAGNGAAFRSHAASRSATPQPTRARGRLMPSSAMRPSRSNSPNTPALASRTRSNSPNSPILATQPTFNTPTFTAFDYVCEGIKNLGPTKEQPDLWQGLLRNEGEWGSFYQAAPGVLRSQLPGCSSHSGNSSSWVKVSSPGP